MSANAPVGDAYACVAARTELAVNFGAEAPLFALFDVFTRETFATAGP